MLKLKGLITAIITPFKADGQLDIEGLRNLIRRQIESGVNGIAALGTTGEAATLTFEEKKQVITAAKEEINRRIPLLVGTGSFSTAQTIENTRMAKELGADGSLMITPYYNRPTQEGFYQHFKAITDAVDFPIMIYNNPHRTGQSLANSTLIRLAEIPNIIGIKESTGSLMQFNEIIEFKRAHRTDFIVMTGDDPLAFPTLACGGEGVISVLSNLVPKLIQKMVSAAFSENYSAAREIHYQLLPLFRAAFIETNPIPLKAAMNHFDLPAGPCRLPLCPLTPDNEKILLKVLSNYVNLHGAIN